MVVNLGDRVIVSMPSTAYGASTFEALVEAFAIEGDGIKVSSDGPESKDRARQFAWVRAEHVVGIAQRADVSGVRSVKV